jgi:hypothetical protein
MGREAAEEARDTESKTRTPHKVVGNYVLLRDFRTVEDSDGKFSA